MAKSGRHSFVSEKAAEELSAYFKKKKAEKGKGEKPVVEDEETEPMPKGKAKEKCSG